MKLQVDDLYEMQRGLNQHIFDQHQLKEEDVHEKRILALLVELGELANETRCFKYWSTKGPSEKEVILEEYVDGIHFLLSIGLSLKDDRSILTSTLEENDLTTCFLKMYQYVSKYQIEPNVKHYDIMFACFLNIANLLDFSQEEIRLSYFKKNKVNHQRQESNY